LPQSGELARMIGVDPDLVSRPVSGNLADATVDIESPLEPSGEPDELVCEADGKSLLFLRTRNLAKGRISLLNTHTYSQADFDAVGEVLLCPRPLGLLALQGTTLSRLRAVFSGENASLMDERQTRAVLSGPSGVTFHPFSVTGHNGFVVQNFNDTPAAVDIILPTGNDAPIRFVDRFSGQALDSGAAPGRRATTLSLSVSARGRIWAQREE